MAEQKFLVDIDLDKNELKQAVVQNAATSNVPAAPNVGQIYYDTTLETIGIFTSTNGWVYFPSGTASSGYIQDIVATQTAVTISITNNIATITIANATITADGLMSKEDKEKLDNSTSNNTFSTLVERNATGIINVTQILVTDEPTLPKHVATKGYVDAMAQGLRTKEPARVVTSSSITLSGTQTIDGVGVVAGDRVLVINQADPKINGIYIVNTNAWTRATDLTTGASGANVYLFVSEGTVEADTGWVCTSDLGSDIVGTDDLTFVKFSNAGTLEAGAGLIKIGNMINAVAGDTSITINPDDFTVRRNPSGAIVLSGAGTGIGVGVDGTDIIISGNQVTIGNSISKTLYKLVSLSAGTQSTITHNLGTRNVHVTVLNQTTYEEVITKVVHSTTNTVNITSNSATSVIVIISGNVGVVIP